MKDLGSANDIKMRFHIVDAMNSVLERTSYEDIAIKQICNAANISRPTFYRYFLNKESIPQWYIEHYFDIGSFQIGRTLSWYDGHFITLSGLKRASEFFHRLEVPNGCIPLRQYGTKAHVDNLTETLTVYRHIDLTDRLAFQIDTFARTRTNITIRWIAAGMELPVAVFADYTNSVVPPELFDLLELPSSDLHGDHDIAASADAEDVLSADAIGASLADAAECVSTGSISEETEKEDPV